MPGTGTPLAPSLCTPLLHCTAIGFALDWESHKSLKHDRELHSWLPGSCSVSWAGFIQRKT